MTTFRLPEFDATSGEEREKQAYSDFVASLLEVVPAVSTAVVFPRLLKAMAGGDVMVPVTDYAAIIVAREVMNDYLWLTTFSGDEISVYLAQEEFSGVFKYGDTSFKNASVTQGE